MRQRFSLFLPRDWPLLLALLLALGLRLALWGRLPRIGLIGDEAEYLAAADWLAHGRGFAWHLHYLWTRAPLYPLFLAAHLAVFGGSLEPIFISQLLLSLLNVALVYGLALQVGSVRLGANNRSAAGIAALGAAIYLPLASYNQLLLSETLFISLLLGALLLLGRWAANDGRRLDLAGAGILLGLATLTRGLTLGFLLVAALWIVFRNGNWRAALGFCLAAGLTVLPWTFYASRTYGGLVLVDTSGAFNLAYGARTAYDGQRSDEPTRNFVYALLDSRLSSEDRQTLLADPRSGSCLYAAGDQRLLNALGRPVGTITQAERQQLLSAEATCLLRAAPGAFVAKSLIELVDLFQINYTGAERFSQGFTLGWLPTWYALSLFLLDDTLYVLALPLAVLGWAAVRTFRPPDPGFLSQRTPNDPWGMPYRFAEDDVTTGGEGRFADRRQRSGRDTILSLLGLWLLYNVLVAPLLFAINRFRVPLMPVVFVLAGYGLVWLPQVRRSFSMRYGQLCAGLAALLALAAIAPYAYFEPRAPGADSRWASYLGPYPSSLANTRLALASRSGYLAEQRLAAALGAGDVEAARQALQAPELPLYAAAVGGPLLSGLKGDPQAGLTLQATQAIAPLEEWQGALVRGQLLRQAGDIEGARHAFSPTLVDDQNPVDWAWQWLDPPRLAGDRIDLADDNDLGYIRGFYLGRYDPDLKATVRWASGESWLRFPGAASGEGQQLCLNASSLGWPADLPAPAMQVLLNGQPVGSVALDSELREMCLNLPAQTAGSDLLIELRSPAFVPDAFDLLSQQGPLVGQLRLLAFQLDWAEVR